MGRKRVEKEKKRETLHITIPRNLIEEYKSETEKRGEIPSRIVEDLIKKYLKEL